jgi:hypothetical protein
VKSVAQTLLPLTGDGPHWILQDMHTKCYHVDKLQVLKMYDTIFLLWRQMNSGQFKLTPCGALYTKNKAEHSSRPLQNTAPFNFQQGKIPLCVLLCIASVLKDGKDYYGFKEFLKQIYTFLKETKPVPRALEILSSKLKYKAMATKNVMFDEVDPYCPCLVLLVLRGTDDYTGHAVCLICGLVFDASNKTGIYSIEPDSTYAVRMDK